MKKLKGPDLKMPSLKTPAFLNDLYYDLRDRRLLPLVGLAIVAIAAVPFLLGDSEEPHVSSSTGGLSALGSEKVSKLTVVEATPGLRQYRKRLSDRSPTDPFKQRYTGLPESAQLDSGSGAEASAGGGSSPTVTESNTETPVVVEGGTSGGSAPSGGGAGGGNGGNEGSGGGSGPAQELEFVIDVQVSHTEKTADGSEKLSEWKARHDVPVLTKLPSEKAPVVTLLGGNFETQGVVFLVSHTVKSISGDFRCASRTEVCELLEVAPGAMLEYVYEPTGVRYAIKVTNSAVIPARQHRAARSSRAAFMLPHSGLASAP